MATMNPVLRLRRAFRSMGGSEPRSDEVADALADEVADAISDYSHSRQESDLRFERLMAQMDRQTAELRKDMADLRREMAEFRTQVLLAIILASGLIIGAVGLLIAFLD